MNATANLGKAPVRTLVLQLAIPSMTAQFVNVLYSIIDRMYIGHISENGALALAGAGICGPIVTLLTSFGTLVGIGGSITMGIRMGEKNHKKAEQVLANSFLILFDKISTQFISFFNYALICFFLRNFYSHTSLQSATPTRLSINTSFRRSSTICLVTPFFSIT